MQLPSPLGQSPSLPSPQVPQSFFLTLNGNVLFSGNVAPAAALGNNGDYYLRSDTPGTLNQRVYIKSAGAWVGIL